MAWNLDPTHLEVGFSARHLMVSRVRGRFTDVEADIHIDDANPDASRVVARIRTASVTTDAADRDAHLRSADFFDVERYPEMRFESTRVTRKGDDIEIRGDLTIKDVTRPVTLKGEFAGPVAGPWGGRSLGFDLEAEIDREDWGLSWNVALEAGGFLVSRKIKLHIAAEVVEAAAVAA
ncbi:MAG: YceI family protein [Dehalococcoidia bacterium]